MYGVFLFTTQFTLPMVVTTAAYSLIISKLATRGGVTRSQGAGAGRNTVRGRYIYNIYSSRWVTSPVSPAVSDYSDHAYCGNCHGVHRWL